MKLGISSHTYKWAFGIPGYPQPEPPLDGERLIEKAVSLGVELIQFGDNYPLHTKTEEELSRLRALAGGQNIELEIGTTGTAPDHLLSYLETARRLDSPLVRTRIGSKDKHENLEIAERNLRAVLPEFEKQRVLLVLENYEMHPVRRLADLIVRVNSANLGACLDTGNSIAALETPEVVVDALAPLALCLHIKDFRFKRVDYGLGYSVEGCPVGSGLLKVDSVFSKVKPYGKLLSVVLEQWTPYQGNIEDTLALQDRWVAESLEVLRKFFPQFR